MSVQTVVEGWSRRGGCRVPLRRGCGSVCSESTRVVLLRCVISQPVVCMAVLKERVMRC